MNWNAIGAVGEILGAAAVFLSLIYLAFQIRQSTVVARSTIRHQITQGVTSFSEIVTMQPELAKAWIDSYEREIEPHRWLQLQAWSYVGIRKLPSTG